MAIEIRVESSWDTDDGEGRTIEVTVCERRHPAEDPVEDTRYFAGGEREALKRYLANLVDAKWASFQEPRRRECATCGRVIEIEIEIDSEIGTVTETRSDFTEPAVTCPDCLSSSA